MGTDIYRLNKTLLCYTFRPREALNSIVCSDCVQCPNSQREKGGFGYISSILKPYNLN